MLLGLGLGLGLRLGLGLGSELELGLVVNRRGSSCIAYSPPLCAGEHQARVQHTLNPNCNLNRCVQLNDRLEHGILSAVVAPVGAYK